VALAGHWHWAAAGPHRPCLLCGGLGRRPLGLRLRRSSSSKCHPILSVSCLRDSLSKPASRGLPHHRSERTRSSKSPAVLSPPASITSRALPATPPAESTPVLAPSVCPPAPGGVSVGSVFCYVPDGHRHRRARGHSMPSKSCQWMAARGPAGDEPGHKREGCFQVMGRGWGHCRFYPNKPKKGGVSRALAVAASSWQLLMPVTLSTAERTPQWQDRSVTLRYTANPLVQDLPCSGYSCVQLVSKEGG
jgi:hypothetical protein